MFSSRAVSSPPHFEDGVFPWTQSTPEDARGRIRTSDLDSLLDDSVRSKSDHSLRIPSSLPKPTGSSSATAANAPPRKPKRLAHRRSRSDPVDAQDIEALRQAASRTSEPVDLSIYLNGDVHVPKHVMLYKTELCKAYLKKGSCKYGAGCHFAHGVTELRRARKHPRFKTEMCKAFHESGSCSFGTGCAFIHDETEEELQRIRGGVVQDLTRSFDPSEEIASVASIDVKARPIQRPCFSPVDDKMFGSSFPDPFKDSSSTTF